MAVHKDTSHREGGTDDKGAATRALEKHLPSVKVLSTWTVYNQGAGLARDDDRRTMIFGIGGIEHLLVAGKNVGRDRCVVLHLAFLRIATAATDVEGGVRVKTRNAARRNGDVDPHTTGIDTRKTNVAVDTEDMEIHLQKVVKIKGGSITVDEDEVQRRPLLVTSLLGLLELSVKKTKDPVAHRTTNTNEAHHPVMMTLKGTSVEAQVRRLPIDTVLFGTLVWVPLDEWWNVWI